MRFSARMTGAALVVTAALALTGCSGDTPADAAGGGHQSSASSDKPAQDEGGADGGGVSLDAGALVGRWEHGSIAQPDYVMVTFTPDRGVIVTTESASCIGDYDESGQIHTKCKKGHGFESGTVKDSGKNQLTVTWDGGKPGVYTKADDM